MPSAWSSDVCRSEEHTSELQSHDNLVCRLLLEKKITRRPGSTAAGDRVRVAGPYARAGRPLSAPPVGTPPPSSRHAASASHHPFSFFLIKGPPPRPPPFPPPHLSG